MSAAADPAVSSQKKLAKLCRKRLERFVTLLPKALVSDDAETIHDLRVWSRRLQQALRIMPSDGPAPKSNKIFRMLRQARRAFGACRDLDVNIDLISARRQHAAATVRQAWTALQSELVETRRTVVEMARREIARHDLYKFIERAQALIDNAGDETAPVESLEQASAQSMQNWEQAYRLAYEHRDPARLHELRIAGKRLRYQVELLALVGQSKAQPLVEKLKESQTALGDWHDRCLLMQCVAEYIGRPRFLTEHPDMGRTLLAEIEKEKLRNDAAVDGILRAAAKVRETWLEWKPGGGAAGEDQ